MDALVDSFYNSYSSAGPDTSKFDQKRSDPSMFDEIELLKITGTPADLERFNRNIGKIKKKWDIEFTATLVVPEQEVVRHHIEQHQRNNPQDFLDVVFTDKIPLFHDMIMMGEPESEYLRVVGSHYMVNLLNRCIENVVYDKNIDVQIVVCERKKIYTPTVVEKVVPTMNDVDNFFDSIYSYDFSKSFPTFHNWLVA
jgi:hypothetical protein